jgi:hypothetical protein
MPAAQTHVFIAHLVLDRIRRGVPDGRGNVRVFLPILPAGAAPARPPHPRRPLPPAGRRVPGRLGIPEVTIPLPEPPVAPPAPPEPVSVLIPGATVATLLSRPASFCFGAASPDFMPDVISGITTSHQPKNRPGQTLDTFMETFGRSVRWSDPAEVSWLLGWFCHLCADVFGHHWVGVEAGGDFLSWVTTPPEVVRRHLGIEMEWAKDIRTRTGCADFLGGNVLLEFGIASWSPDDAVRGPFFFRRQLVFDAVLTDGAPLCERFYDIEAAPSPAAESAQLVHPMIQVRKWRSWHAEQKGKAERAKALNDSPLGAVFDFDLPRVPPDRLAAMRLPCPLCKAHGAVTQTVERACPVCYGIGMLEDKARRECIFCRGEGKHRVDCAACEGLPDPLRDVCPECHGARKVDNLCPVCFGAKELSEGLRSLCPRCKGARQVRQDLDAACPFCAGQKYLETALGDPAYSSRDLIGAVLRRLIHFHGARIERIERLSNLYLDAGERMALLLLSPEPDLADGKKVQECFALFLDELGDFCLSTVTLSDLAPELEAYDAAVAKAIEELLALPMKLLEFLPLDLLEVFERMKKELVKAAVDELANRFKSMLTGAECGKLRTKALDRYAPQAFPPVADAVSLFLLALDGSAPTAPGLAGTFRTLGKADNIDGRNQPRAVAPYLDAAFPWDGRFRLVKRSGKGEEADIALGL